MNPLAWLIGLILPACGFPAAKGLPTPPLMDMGHITRPASPNAALAGPAGFQPKPDILTPVYHVPPDRLFAAVQHAAARQPRTFETAIYREQRQVHYVARSAAFNFPDLVTAQVQPNGTDGSTLIVYSRSVYGYSDFGANRRRAAAWLATINTDL